MKRRHARVLGASLIGFVALVTATAALLACRPAAAALAMVSCGEEHMSQFLIAPDRQRLDAVLAQFRQLCSQTVHGPVRIKVRCDTPGWAATSQGTNHRDYGYSLGHACGFATRAEAERAAKDECRKKPTESGCVIQEWSGCDDGTIFEPATNSGAHYSLKHFAQEHRGGAGGACIGSRPTGSAGAGGTRLARPVRPGDRGRRALRRGRLAARAVKDPTKHRLGKRGGDALPRGKQAGDPKAKAKPLNEQGHACRQKRRVLVIDCME